MPLIDQQGNDTLWETVYYSESDRREINDAMKRIYALLKTDGDVEVLDHLTVARIDFCTFGNTKPFRVRIINRLNDNYDHFYVKKADASRIYGLELEDILSPNRVMFMVDRDTLVEEHVAGIPGDDFMRRSLDDTTFNQIRIAKEFIKFNERCFVRLLGDMHSSNYVVEILPDFDDVHYRIRAIDFDQQSYEPRKSIYMPQYYKKNMPIIEVGIRHMNNTTVRQYQKEERAMIASRIRYSLRQVMDLMAVMSRTPLSKPEYVEQLRRELAQHHKCDAFLRCNTMGAIVRQSLKLLIENN